jgi:phenylalanyl-tRNA synthetase alpha chain
MKIYQNECLKRQTYKVPLDEQEALLTTLKERGDTDAERLQRYIALPDLTRLDGNPVKMITDVVIGLPSLKNLDLIETPEIISPELVFDLFNFPKDHPARTSSDTYYVDETHILRPHTSLMWKYYLDIPDVLERLEKNGMIGTLSYGTVYRRDEIDWQHSNVLHHIDGLFICRKDIKEVGEQDLKDILTEVAEALYGKDVESRFNLDRFPYTDPSIEMEIKWNDEWVEILGAGIPHPKVIENLGLDPEKYTAWAFGFGADRLAMIKMRIPDIRLLRSDDTRVTQQFSSLENVYEPVSKYPPIVRDISFVVDADKFNIFEHYELIREVASGEYVEEMEQIDKYENEERFGKGKVSYAFRIVYRHLDKTLTREEVDTIHSNLEAETKKRWSAEVR